MSILWLKSAHNFLKKIFPCVTCFPSHFGPASSLAADCYIYYNYVLSRCVAFTPRFSTAYYGLWPTHLHRDCRGKI